MEHQNVSAGTRRAKKACTECRQQKARCDVANGSPCSRCRKVNATCIISDPFKRENKRQKLNELEQETQELREQLESISESRGKRKFKAKTIYSDTENDTTAHEAEAVKIAPEVSETAHGPTLSRSIDGLELDGHEIDTLFQLYFSDYSQNLPVLDPSKSPNAYYETSLFLFWAIIGVASRAFSKAPTLSHNLRPCILDLAFESLKVAPTLESIQGLLLIVTWPFPKRTGIWNPTFALLGAVLHCAMNIGLHLPYSYQEFNKFRSQLTEADIRQRTKVWAYCVMVHQRTIICKGSSAFTLNDLCQDPKARSVIFERLDGNTAFRLRLQDIVTRALRAFTECGLQDMTSEQDRTLKLLIETYQTQLQDFGREVVSTIDELHFVAARLILQMFHLFRNKLVTDMEPITSLFSFACQTLERFDQLSQLPTIGLKALPFTNHFALLNASQILLRLYKTPVFSTCIDGTRAKAMVLLAINLAKKMSVEEDDLAGRSVKALSDVVDSQKAFRSLDGDGLPVPLRVRSRSAMSVVLDGLIWWREEFGGTMGVYPVSLKASTGIQKGSLAATPSLNATTLPMSDTRFLEPFDTSFDSFLSGQAWMGCEDLLSPSYFGGFGTDSI